MGVAQLLVKAAPLSVIVPNVVVDGTGGEHGLAGLLATARTGGPVESARVTIAGQVQLAPSGRSQA
jgi:hypothetical protein